MVLLAWAAAACEDLNNPHASATARAWPFKFEWLLGRWGVLRGWSGCRRLEQLPRLGDRLCPVAIGQKACVANAVKAFWQHVHQEAADKFRRGERHGFIAAGAFDAIILDGKGDALGVGGDQALV
jgi:hypothetical protein